MLVIMQIACFGAMAGRYQFRAMESVAKAFWFGGLPKNPYKTM